MASSSLNSPAGRAETDRLILMDVAENKVQRKRTSSAERACALATSSTYGDGSVVFSAARTQKLSRVALFSPVAVANTPLAQEQCAVTTRDLG